MNIKIILSVFVENIIYSKLYRPKCRLNFPPKFVKKMYFYPDFRPHLPFSDLKGTHVRTRTHSPAYASSRAPSDAYAYVHARYFSIFALSAHARRTTHAHHILSLYRRAFLACILSVITPQRVARAYFIGRYAAAYCMLASREKISRVSSAFYPSFRLI